VFLFISKCALHGFCLQHNVSDQWGSISGSSAQFTRPSAASLAVSVVPDAVALSGYHAPAKRAPIRCLSACRRVPGRTARPVVLPELLLARIEKRSGVSF